MWPWPSRARANGARLRRSVLGAALGFAVGALAACSGEPATCASIPVAQAAAAVVEEAADILGWEPVLPCAYVSGLAVERAGASRTAEERSVTLVVGRGGDQRFVFTQGTAAYGSTAIPIGTRRVSLEAAGVQASGFEGPSPGAGTMLYLRWEADGRVFEYQAPITSRFPRSEAYRTARGLIELTAPPSLE